jgi:hypothetical protein
MVCVFNMHFLPCPQGKHKGCRCESDKDTGLMKCPPRLSGCPLTLEKAQGPQLQYSAYVWTRKMEILSCIGTELSLQSLNFNLHLSSQPEHSLLNHLQEAQTSSWIALFYWHWPNHLWTLLLSLGVAQSSSILPMLPESWCMSVLWALKPSEQDTSPIHLREQQRELREGPQTYSAGHTSSCCSSDQALSPAVLSFPSYSYTYQELPDLLSTTHQSLF